jgi:uncharacterized protein (TIRG00374 family)
MRSDIKIVFKKVNWFLLIRLTGIVIFIIVLFNVDVQSIWINIKKVNPGYFLLAVLFQFILLFLKGLRWHILNDNSSKPTNIYQSLGEFFESYAIGVITPGRLGELLKAGHQKEKKDMIGSGIQVLAERGMDVGFFLFIAGSAIVWGNLIDINNNIGILPMGFGFLISVFSIVLISNKRITNWMGKLSVKITIELKKRNYREVIAIIILSLLSNLFYFISCFFLVVGINLNMSFLLSSGGIAISGLINMMPVTVMGLGTRELTFKVTILAFSGLIFLVAQIGGGIISLFLGQIFLFLAKKHRAY